MGKTLPEYACRVCGLSSKYDKNFHKKDKLCNRHWNQIKRNGKSLDSNMIIPEAQNRLTNCCEICGDTESIKYYFWKHGGQYQGKELCNKHYNQLLRHGHLLDDTPSEHKKRHKWTKEEDLKFEELYKEGLSFEEICKEMNMEIGMIRSRSCYLKLGDKYMRSNNPKFKAPYQNYDWCYQRYVIQGMSHQQMADECGVSLRVIQKWCCEIYKLNARTFKENKEMTDLQYQIILFGTLGDGHIDKREDQPLYIESHAMDEKDYVFWKYEQLRDLCNSPPKYYEESYTNFGTSKFYLCQPYYRFETRIINQLKEIRGMKRLDKIKQLNDLGLSLHVLDDGCRNDLWKLCLAEYSQKEIDLYVKLCKERFDLNAKQEKDKRYIRFDAESSRKIDKIILENIPNNLDIIKKKITQNPRIKNEAKYVYIICGENNKKGLNTYCRDNGIPYKRAKYIVDLNNISKVEETKFLELMKKGESNEVQ